MGKAPDNIHNIYLNPLPTLARIQQRKSSASLLIQVRQRVERLARDLSAVILAYTLTSLTLAYLIITLESSQAALKIYLSLRHNPGALKANVENSLNLGYLIVDLAFSRTVVLETSLILHRNTGDLPVIVESSLSLGCLIIKPASFLTIIIKAPLTTTTTTTINLISHLTTAAPPARPLLL